jgi:hypothetical protein
MDDLQAQELETTLRTQGQRRINLIWEITQSVIALVTVLGGVGIMVHDSLVGGPRAQIPTTLSSMIFLVLGFYFARTNHSATGGVGPTHHTDQRR